MASINVDWRAVDTEDEGRAEGVYSIYGRRNGEVKGMMREC